jgi:cobalt-zinc-cadmium efflux system outer membrane protein
VLPLWSLAFLLGAGPGADAGQDGAPLSLAQARELAVRAGPDVVLADLRARAARTDIDVAGALANPTLALQTARLTARLTTTLSVPLPLFGQRHMAVSAAKADAGAAALGIDAVRVDARWNATRAWLDLWEAQEKARLFAAAAADADRIARIADERFAAGSAPRVDVIRTRADRVRSRAEADAMASAVPAAAARLAVWIGDGASRPLRATGSIDLGPLPAEEDALTHLAADHPALRRDRAQVEAAAAHVRSQQRLRWPVINADVGVAQGDPTLTGTDVFVGLSFEAPVLSLRGGAIARARADQALAEATTDTELRRLVGDLIAAYRESESASLRARALVNDVLPALEEARRMIEEGYRDGRVDLLRVLEAQSAAREARRAAVEAQAAWQRSRADVERAVGFSPTGGGAREP